MVTERAMRTRSTARGARQPEGYREFPNLQRRNCIQERLEVPALVWLLRLPRGRRMLEVGCGRGVALPVLAELCEPSRLTGLDVDPGKLAAAERHLSARGVAAELRCGDVRQMPFPDGAFDVVIDFGTCFHVSRPEAALSEISRVLGEGGVLVHETPLSQLLAHPCRSAGRRLPWAAAPELAPCGTALLWSRRVNCEPRDECARRSGAGRRA